MSSTGSCREICPFNGVCGVIDEELLVAQANFQIEVAQRASDNVGGYQAIIDEVMQQNPDGSRNAPSVTRSSVEEQLQVLDFGRRFDLMRTAKVIRIAATALDGVYDAMDQNQDGCSGPIISWRGQIEIKNVERSVERAKEFDERTAMTTNQDAARDELIAAHARVANEHTRCRQVPIVRAMKRLERTAFVRRHSL